MTRASRRVLARLGAERFHHRIAGQRVGQRAADPGVPGVGDARGRRDVARREQHDHRNIDRSPDRDHEAERRPVQPEQDHRAQQHHQRRQQRHQDGVVQQVERPHAAGDLAHRRAGKAVGVPVGREALHAHERVARHVGHDPQRERHDRLQPEQAAGSSTRGRATTIAPKATSAAWRAAGSAAPEVIASTRRPENTGMNRSATVAPSRPAAMAAATTGWLQPVAEHEGQHHADRGGALVELSGHGVIRLRAWRRPAPLLDACRAAKRPTRTRR